MPNLLRMTFACVGLDWTRPSSSSTDRIDQIAAATAVASTDRSKSRWKQNQRANKEEEALQKTSTAINKAYELTTPRNHTRPQRLTSYIGVRRPSWCSDWECLVVIAH